MSTIKRVKTDGGGVRYEARFDVPGRGGSRVQRRRRFTTKKAAEDFLHKSKADEMRGRITPDARNTITVTEAIDRWLIEKEAEGLRPASLASLANSLKGHVAPRSIGSMRVVEVRGEHIVTLYREIRDHGHWVAHGSAGRCRTAGVTCKGFPGCSPEKHASLGAKSRLHIHGALRGLFGWLVDEGVVTVNPCEEKRVRKNLPERVREDHRITNDDYWDSEQARAFLEACREHGDPLTILWEVALATGLRRAELAGLLWQYVDLDAGVIRVRRSTTAVLGRTVTTEGRGKGAGKTHAAHRDVPIGPSTVALLRAHKIAQAPGAVDVFTERGIEPIHPDRISRKFRHAAQRAGLHKPGLGIHSLRHYAITSWLRNGVPVATASKIAGHEDISITLRLYTHAMPADDALVAAAMESSLYSVKVI